MNGAKRFFLFVDLEFYFRFFEIVFETFFLSLILQPYPNTPLQEQKWNERREHFSKLCSTHKTNLPFLTATCQLVYSESVQSRDCAAFGLRPIIYECINSNSLIQDHHAIRFVNEYFTNLRQQAIRDKELCSRTVQGKGFYSSF